ncbi:ComEC/Rec2 family competence protein [Oceanivirga salmonicida]|uniref:ComEC/Rec2 family competence protein n=1 Tax=Oceanivirga salmonicida TaxID=1769291 RepID=UPI0012E1196F|nr:ComEC/Rec2 family competence protein [Oceanivirga salmonicida]
MKLNRYYIIIFIILYFIYLYMFTYKNEAIFSKDIYITSDIIYIKKINNKMLTKMYIEKNIYDIENSGNYTLYFKDGEYLGYRSSKFNNIRIYLDNLMKKEFNYNLYSYIKALFLYDKSYMQENDKNMLKSLGISHIFSLSGFHLSLIYMIILTVFSKTSINKREIIAIILISIYVFTIGFIPSITRAYILIIILSLSKILNEKVNTKKSFYIALLSTLIINPYQILNISYILTYLVTYTIICTKQYNIIIKNIIIELVCLPLIFYVFGSVNLAMFLINLIFIPIFTVFIYLSLLTIIFRIEILKILTSEYLDLIRILMKNLSDIEIFTLRYTKFNFSLIIIIYLIIFSLFLVSKRDDEKVYIKFLTIAQKKCTLFLTNLKNKLK